MTIASRGATVAWRLCAPIQYWGLPGSRHQDRPNADWPTHAAITGIIACAMGYDRDDPRQLPISDRAQTVRIDHPGRAGSDYQTIAGTVNTDGAARAGGQVVSRRGVLHDACFTVFCTWEDTGIADDAHTALLNPAAALRMGRTGAPFTPESIPYRIDDDIDAALIGSWPTCPHHRPTADTWTVVAAAARWEPTSTVLDDSRLTGVPREYAVRPVMITTVPRTDPPPTEPAPEQPTLRATASGQILLPGETDGPD